MPIEQHVEEAVKAIKNQKDTQISIPDLCALVKHLARQIAISERSHFQRTLQKNEADFRTNVSTIVQELERTVEQAGVSQIVEYTNFLNVFRLNNAEYMFPQRYRIKLIKRLNALFTEDQYKAEAD